MVFWMSGKQNFGNAIRITFGLLEHRKLVRIDGLIFVNARLNVPAGEVSTKSSRKSAGAESTYRSSLPKAVVNVTTIERWLFRARVFERLSDGTFPGNFGNFIVGINGR